MAAKNSLDLESGTRWPSGFDFWAAISQSRVCRTERPRELLVSRPRRLLPPVAYISRVRSRKASSLFRDDSKTITNQPLTRHQSHWSLYSHFVNQTTTPSPTNYRRNATSIDLHNPISFDIIIIMSSPRAAVAKPSPELFSKLVTSAPLVSKGH